MKQNLLFILYIIEKDEMYFYSSAIAKMNLNEMKWNENVDLNKLEYTNKCD